MTTIPTTHQVEVRTCTAEDMPQFGETFGSSFGFVPTEEDRAQWARVIEPSRMLGAFEGATMVGTAGAFAFDMTVPGGEVRTAGVTVVGVRPSHRRRGIMATLMRRQLDDIHAWGEPVAILWASESNIYQRYGYGLGTYRTTIDVERGRTEFLQGSTPVGRTRLISPEEAQELLPEVYERARIAIPGALRRSPVWWETRRLADDERRRRGGGPMFRALLDLDGRPEGYALYRVHSDWGEDGLPVGWLEVIEALGMTPIATREIWRFLFGIDLVSRVKTTRLAADHPLFLMLAEPRRLRSGLFDGIWLRVVDVPAALAARTYLGSGELVLEVDDAFCPWNDGRWCLEAGAEGARVGRTAREPDLRLTAAELGAAYLGGVSFANLVRAGRVEEVTLGALARADDLFRSPTPPWCLDDF